MVRFAMSRFVYRFVEIFPMGTLVVNVVACFLVGIFIELLDEKFAGNPLTRVFLTIGFCGGFSTFSTFSFETLELFRSQQYFYAFANIGLSVVLCLLFTYLGMVAAKFL